MDQLTTMRAFVRVAETGSFSVVARENDTTQSTISKQVAALEEKLGTKLLIRSSREQSLTEAGRDYYQRCLPILEAVDEAETVARCHTETPRGLLRITAAVDFSQRILAPLLDEFMERYPDIRLDLVLDNYRVDLVAAGVDVAIRADRFRDSSLITKPLCSNPLQVVAAPSYLAQYGYPQRPDDLRDHQCLTYSPHENPHLWTFTHKKKTQTVPVSGRFQCNNGDLQLGRVLMGKGIAILPHWIVHETLERGELEIVLADYMLPSLPLNMVYPDRKYLPLKTRCFLDFMVEKVGLHPAFNP